MDLKQIKILSPFILLLISFPIHFIYNIFPNFLTSIFFPVNESIWEHMKILFTAQILYSILENILIKKNNIKVNNYICNIFITSLLSVIIYLIIYIPIRIVFGENLIISILLMLITYIIASYISYNILLSKKYNISNIFPILLIIISYILFAYLTYNPPQNNLFLDTNKNIYGIQKR